MTATLLRSKTPAQCLLAAGVAFALSSTLRIAPAIAEPPPATIVVTRCDDAGEGSLRWALASAVSGDTVDLTTLECSLITLTSGELSTSADDLTLVGAGVEISAYHGSRVLSHLGTGTLQASGMTFEDGHVESADASLGGCIYSRGNVSLYDVTVQSCFVTTHIGDSCQSRGGGVYARGALSLDHASISGNSAHTDCTRYAYVTGAGVASRGALSIISTAIFGNVAGDGDYNQGGGFYSSADTRIENSTISANYARFAGAGAAIGPSLSMINSTISLNQGYFRSGGLAANVLALDVRNSTITANWVQSTIAGRINGAGLLSWAGANTIESSIIAGNTFIFAEDDLDIEDSTPISGRANLIGAVAPVTTLPDDTLRSDPMLAPLADNGGPTWTHALLPGSPAINHGANTLDLPWDGRGEGHPRVLGGHADIGAFELELPETILVDGFDPQAG